MVWSVVYTIMMEVTVERRRGLTGGIANVGWNVGSMVMALSAFLLRSWHWMQLFNAAFSLTLVAYYFLVPGSAHTSQSVKMRKYSICSRQ